jgi:hypothetical protein
MKSFALLPVEFKRAAARAELARRGVLRPPNDWHPVLRHMSMDDLARLGVLVESGDPDPAEIHAVLERTRGNMLAPRHFDDPTLTTAENWAARSAARDAGRTEQVAPADLAAVERLFALLPVRGSCVLRGIPDECAKQRSQARSVSRRQAVESVS